MMTASKNLIEFMLITANPEIAKYAETNNVSRIFIDQETLGKQERQGHLNTHRASHTAEDIKNVAAVLTSAELMVRVNPLNPNSRTEIETAIECGCQRLMLPMFTCKSDVAKFLDFVGRRVPVSFLAETPQALVRLEDWLPLLKPGYDEVHIGLNDLSLGLGVRFLFEPLAARMIEIPSQVLNDSGVTWGFGGIAQVGKGELPSELVLGEHVRLGSERVILSRAFHKGVNDVAVLANDLGFAKEIGLIRSSEREWRQASEQALLENQRRLRALAFDIGAADAVRV
ncbi:MAG: aldolase [Idiomarina sp.]|nr:aldolase [Idiomarina sp.]